MEQLHFNRPAAVAYMAGSREYPHITGTVSFYDAPGGTMVVTDIRGLPSGGYPQPSRIFGLHIHEGISCSGSLFSDTGGHFNPLQTPHPYHAGDLPPLFASDGRAYMAVLIGRFRVFEIIGRTVVIHSDPDDFVSQPSGNAGEKIACGVIRQTAP